MASAIPRPWFWHPPRQDAAFERISDHFCPECGGTSSQIGSAHWQCENCRNRFIVEPAMEWQEGEANSRDVVDSYRSRSMTRNPYPVIKCYYCRSAAIKSSADTYWCPRCKRHLPAAYPRNWLQLRIKVFKRDRWQCTHCGRRVWLNAPPDSGASPHCAHLVPVHDGGTHEKSNLRTLCEECHLDEHPERREYFLRYRQFYNQTRRNAPTRRRPHIRTRDILKYSFGIIFWIFLLSVFL